MDILLTWVGTRDPAWQNPRTGRFEAGPILSLLQHRAFDLVYLLFTPASPVADFRRQATKVLRLCRRHLPHVDVRQKPVDLLFPTDYREVFRLTNDVCQEILAEHGQDGRQYFVYLSPGTPQMQVAWILLVQAGLFPARMIESRSPELLAPGAPYWREVDLSLQDFPQVTTPGETARLLSVLRAQNDNLLAENRRLRAAVEVLEAGPKAPSGGSIPAGFQLRHYLVAKERAWYVRAIDQVGGSAAGAARLLGIDPAAFRARAASLGIRPRRRPGNVREVSGGWA